MNLFQTKCIEIRTLYFLIVASTKSRVKSDTRAERKCKKLNEGLHALLDDVLIHGEQDIHYNLDDQLIYQAACKIPSTCQLRYLKYNVKVM